MKLFEFPVQIGTPAEERPYTPSFLADDLRGEPQIIDSPGVVIGNGYKPGASNGGVIEVGGRLLGCDFLSAVGDSRYLHLRPAEKAVVQVDAPETNLGTVVGEGIGVLTDYEQGKMIFSGLVTASNWLAEFARTNGNRVSQIEDGLFVVQAALPMRGEIIDVSPDKTVTAKLL